MKSLYPFFVLVLMAMLLADCSSPQQPLPEREEEAFKEAPSDWFFNQRAYPHGQINKPVYMDALRQKKALEQLGSRNNAEWTFEGPLNTGGRITDVEMHPSSMDIIYAGAASGGVFRSNDQGTSWEPIFDDALSLSIGDIGIAPSDPNTLYVGTGESNAGGGSLAYDGVGVYRSTDGGNNWEHLGLENVGSIGKVLIHPEDPDRVWVASMGSLFANNEERGVYRTEDGGQNWEQVLFVSDSTGAIDLAMHPSNPDTLYAAMWERIRRVDRRQYGGPTSGVYRSTDGGATWSELITDLPQSDNGRIGLAVSPAAPDWVYAMYTDEIGFHKDIYRSEDNGDSWSVINSGLLLANNVSYCWWFGRLFIDPQDPEKIFACHLDAYRSDNGTNWENISNNENVQLHVDQHSFYIHPEDPDLVLLGNDGGMHKSLDGGTSWEHLNTLPITQFYTCEVDNMVPERLYGGTQDNGTIRTLTGADDDWNRILGGDGMVVKVNPWDNNFIYAESQYGFLYKSINGGITFNFILNFNINAERRNWKTPYVLDPNDSQRLFYGSQRLFRSTNEGLSWVAISPDLTGNPPPQTNSFFYGTITSIELAAADGEMVFVGTDNGMVWKTTNGGALSPSWELLSEELPDRWVTSFATHPIDEEIAYVTFSGYRYNEYQGHVFRTIDGGATWEDLSLDLPEVPVNDIAIDPDETDRLYVATDIGVFVSFNGGTNWEPLGSGLPNVVVNEICLHQPTRKLVAATFGRSMYSLSLDDVVADLEVESPVREIKVFPNPATDLVQVQFYQDWKAETSIRLFDTNGRMIKQIFQGQLDQGEHQFGVDLNGLATGSYICQVSSGEKRTAKRIVKVD